MGQRRVQLANRKQWAPCFVETYLNTLLDREMQLRLLHADVLPRDIWCDGGVRTEKCRSFDMRRVIFAFRREIDAWMVEICRLDVTLKSGRVCRLNHVVESCATFTPNHRRTVDVCSTNAKHSTLATPGCR